MLQKLPEQFVIEKIFHIRGLKVMLDEDLALLYGVPTKRINEQVKRNSERFPLDFMFQLTSEEYENLRSQIATANSGKRRFMPYAFTEHGVLMLSSVLSSEQAIQVNIQVMRIFTKIRGYLSDHTRLQLDVQNIKLKMKEHDKNLELVFSYVDELTEKATSP